MKNLSIQTILFYLLTTILPSQLIIAGGFPAGTPVKTATGYQPIETIKSGQTLTSYCPVTGFLENQVTFIWRHSANTCVAIRYLQTELIASTQQRFYLPESASWVAASKLQPGDKLLSEKHGHITIDAVEPVIFTGFTHCVQFDKNCNFCVSDDDIVTHNFAIKFDLTNLPTTPEEIVCILCAAAFLFIAERIIASLGYNANFCVNQNGSIGGHKPFAGQNNTVDFDNPYAYYGYKNPADRYDNSSYYNNDVYAHHNDLVTQQTYHKSTIQTDVSKPLVSLTQLSPIKDNHQPQQPVSALVTQPASLATQDTDATHCPTITPDPSIEKKPTGCPIPTVPTPIHTGGCGGVIKPEKIIHPTPAPEIEKKPQGCFPPITSDISQIVLTADKDSEKPEIEEKEVKISDNEDDIKHIFRDSEGHLSDTPENRNLLTDMASNKKNFQGVDRFGLEWYAKTLDNGKQLWARVRNGCIKNGGLNEIAQTFNPSTGLCRQIVKG